MNIIIKDKNSRGVGGVKYLIDQYIRARSDKEIVKRMGEYNKSKHE